MSHTALSLEDAGFRVFVFLFVRAAAGLRPAAAHTKRKTRKTRNPPPQAKERRTITAAFGRRATSNTPRTLTKCELVASNAWIFSPVEFI